MLEVKNLTKQYKKSDSIALNSFSYSFNETGLYLITGRSGSGKTTLLNILSGLDSQTSGDLLFKGTKINKSNYDNYRNKNVGIVFQDLNLINELSIKDNLSLAFDLAKSHYDKSVVEEILKKVNLPDKSESLDKLLSRHPNELSGGQKQRIAIARTLIKDPDILCLDEPTSSLDKSNATDLAKLLGELSKEKLIIVSTHDLDFFSKYAISTIELEAGNIYKITNNEGLNNTDSAISKDRSTKETKDKKHGLLSIKNSFKLSLQSIAKSKIRLFTSLFITIISTVAMKLFLSIINADQNKIFLDKQYQTTSRMAFLETRFQGYSPDGNFVDTSITPNTEQKEKLNSNTKNVFQMTSMKGGYLQAFGWDSSMLDSLTKYVLKDSSSQSQTAIELDPDIDLSYIGFEKATENSRLPQNYNEIALPDTLAYGLIKYAHIRTFDYGDGKNTFEESKNYDELIGKTLCGYKITGVFKIDDLPSILLNTSTNLNKDCNELLKGSSICCYPYLKAGYQEEVYKEPNPSYTYIYRLSGDINEDLRFIQSLNVKDENGLNYYAVIINNYYSYDTLTNFRDGNTGNVITIIICALLTIAILMIINLCFANTKKNEIRAGILRSMGCTKLGIIQLTITDSLLISSIIFLFDLIALGIIFPILNNLIMLNYFTFNIFNIGLLLAVIIGIGLITSLITCIKALKSKPIKIIKNL